MGLPGDDLLGNILRLAVARRINHREQGADREAAGRTAPPERRRCNHLPGVGTLMPFSCSNAARQDETESANRPRHFSSSSLLLLYARRQIGGVFQQQFGDLVGEIFVEFFIGDQQIGRRRHRSIFVDAFICALRNIGVK